MTAFKLSVNSSQLGNFHQRPAHRRSQKENHRLAGSQRPRQEDHQLQAPRLALQPAALLGRAVPDRLEERTRTGIFITKRCRNARCRVLPPPLDDYKPTPDGQPPLARAKDWVNLPDGSTRETNTMPQWAGSCWYYLRYLDAKNARASAARGGAVLDGQLFAPFRQRPNGSFNRQLLCYAAGHGAGKYTISCPRSLQARVEVRRGRGQTSFRRVRPPSRRQLRNARR